MLATLFAKTKIIVATVALVVGFGMAVVPAVVSAQSGPTSTQDIVFRKKDCQVPYAQLNSSNCGIIRYVITITNILSAMVGVVIVGSIVWAGIQYSTSKNDPQKVAAARGRISNSIFALIAYIFMVSFLQWVVPGGVF